MKRFIRQWLGIDEDLALEQLVIANQRLNALTKAQAQLIDMYRFQDSRIAQVEACHDYIRELGQSVNKVC